MNLKCSPTRSSLRKQALLVELFKININYPAQPRAVESIARIAVIQITLRQIAHNQAQKAAREQQAKLDALFGYDVDIPEEMRDEDEEVSNFSL